MMDKTQLEGMVDGLSAVKTEFFRMKDELSVSIRKDVVATELKVIIQDSDNYESLKQNLNNYIAKLYQI